MEITIDFPGGKRVDAHFGKFTIATDQPVRQGGQESAPSPFETFLASIGACAGIYVLGFCQQRNISTEGMKIEQRMETDPETGLVSQIRLDIALPPGFPEKYRDALIRTAEQCTVKKHLQHPPTFEIKTVAADKVPA